MTIQDVRNIVKANLDQLHDIEFSLSQKLYLVKPDVVLTNSAIRIAWHLENGWEKRTTTHLGSKDQLTHVTVHAWDGDAFKITEHCYELDGSPTSKRRNSGLIANTPPTMQDDLFAALLMRNRGGTYVDWLTDEGATMVGTELIDSHGTVVVRVGRMQDGICRQYCLDTTRGGVPLKAEVYVQGKWAKTGTHVSVAEVKPGLYLPVRCEVYSSINHDGKERVAEFAIDVNSIKINQGLTKGAFQVPFEAELPIWDDRIGLGQQEGKDT